VAVSIGLACRRRTRFVAARTDESRSSATTRLVRRARGSRPVPAFPPILRWRAGA